MEQAMNVQRGIPFFVQSRCTSFAPRPAAGVLHPCRQSQPDRRGRSRQRSGEAEGKIKGAARTAPQWQSARGFGTARRLHAAVPQWSAKPDGLKVSGVPSSMRYASLRRSWCHAADPQTAVDAHVRRLEALRRSGAVERMADGVWRIPPDFLSHTQAHDAQRAAGGTIELRSHLSIEQQVGAQGATWLDHQMVGDAKELSPRGFGVQVRDALQGRVNFLVEQGLAERRGSRVVLARNLLSTLRNQELAAAGKVIQQETGLAHRPLRDGERANGIYRRSVQLASGRFAMLDDGMGFSLVPWRPVVEQRLGQQISAIVRGASVTWELGRRQLGR